MILMFYNITTSVLTPLLVAERSNNNNKKKALTVKRIGSSCVIKNNQLINQLTYYSQLGVVLYPV